MNKKLKIFLYCTMLLTACTAKDPESGTNVYDENRPIGWASVNGVTDGSGGRDSITVTSLDELIEALSGTEPKTIMVKDSIRFHGVVVVEKAANKTLLGMPGSLLYNPIHSDLIEESGILLFRSCRNIIMRNLTFRSEGAYDIDGYDNLALEGCEHVWVDHCDFLDGVDGNFDIVEGSDYVSVTWCRFRYLIPAWTGGSGGSDNHCNSNLVGNSDKKALTDSTHLNVTFANCWWDKGCSERMPRMRFGRAHIFNCLYTCTDNVYCIGAGYHSNIYAENNAFINVNMPWKLWATKPGYTDYAIRMVNNMGVEDVTSRSGGEDFYHPDYPYRLCEATKVPAVVGAERNGAGATLLFQNLVDGYEH